MKVYKSGLIFALLGLLTVSASAAGNALSITADELSYNGQTKVAHAVGNVVIDTNGNHMTGVKGTYNMATKLATLEGNVAITGPNLQASAQKASLSDSNILEASGNVHVQKDSDSIAGDYVQYNMNSGYGIANHGTVGTDGTTVQAHHIEAWMHQIHIVATGNVILDSPSRSLHATGDSLVYDQTPGQKDGVALLKGHAYAEQNGNTLQGEALHIEVNTQSVETQGRSTLVIKQ